jgi:hypothetical protein
MNRKTLIAGGLIAILGALAVIVVQAAGKDDLAKLRAATDRFHETKVANAAGYNKVDGLDFCFDNPGVGAMGFHLIDASRLDTQLDMLRPEAMVYAPGPNGQFQLAAVEYIVPASLWNETHTGPPKILGKNLHLDENLGVYVLHAWVWKNNPTGIFEDWNPKVSCP